MNKIKELRDKNFLTQQQLADKSGIKVVTIQKIENGTNSLFGARTETSYRLAKALNTTIEDLIEEYIKEMI